MAQFHYSYEVCNCRKVTLGEIIHAIKDKSADSIESIGEVTEAGTSCKCCRSEADDFGDPKMELYLEQIVKKFAK
jgi:bacterioferritin-associated ferredoxin